MELVGENREDVRESYIVVFDKLGPATHRQVETAEHAFALRHVGIFALLFVNAKGFTL